MKASFLGQRLQAARAELARGLRAIRERGPGQVFFWLLALMVGVASGLTALGFRIAIEWIEGAFYGTNDPAHLHSFAQDLPWYWLLIVPIFGGAVVGQVLHWFTPDGRVRSVADVIEGATLKDGRVELRAGFASGFASLVTLGSGGSSGREGPVVHLAAVISTWVSNRMGASGITARDLLGCAVAAAVSASFNAPIAGALFALEVVLRHFALHAFAPIVIAAVAGTVINRMALGDVTEFALPGGESALAFYAELPAFLLLGLVSGVVAVLLMKAIFVSDDWASHVQARSGLPRWGRPIVAGALLGLIAIYFPHIIGVGYETTLAALSGQIGFWDAIVFALMKAVAVAITMAGRMGGGVFSPSLMMGALTGLAFGYIATGVFPDMSGSIMLYALAGTGAVAAAVLGAPISTTLIVFELTDDWQTAIAVMVAVSISTAISAQMVHRSFFLTQLERRNVRLAAGPQAYLLGMFRVETVMRKAGRPDCPNEERLWELVQEGQYLDASATLEGAMPVFESSGQRFLPVMRLSNEATPPELLGALLHVDALKAYNRALEATAEEEHG